MTKKLFAALAMGTAFLMAGVMTAQASDVTFGGQIRLRGEAWSGTGGTNLFLNDNFNNFVGNRVRLNSNIKVDDDLSAFIQLQSNTRFGSSSSATAGGIFLGGAQAGHNPGDANDDANDVGLHQAYFIQKNLFGLSLAIKAGRQEIVFDGHRIFGNTGWTTGAQSHDGVQLIHAEGNHTIAFIYSKAKENAAKSDGGNFAGPSTDDDTDRTIYALWGNTKGLIGDKSSTSVYLVFDDNDTAGAPPAAFYTFGARQAGAIAGIDYRVEGYFQTGQSGIVDPTSATGATGDRGGYLLAGRVGKTFGNVMWKPNFTLWADYLSGSDLADAATGDRNSFNTVFDTGHKFYGFMDFFLAEQAAGLVDLAIKTSIHPMAKTTLKLDLHHFERAEEVTVGGDKTLGQEIDITLIYKYSANMKMSAGYSRFLARDLFVGGAGSTASTTNYDDAQWAYVMMDMKF